MSEEVPAPLPAPRAHAYLPGTSHPLFPEKWAHRGRERVRPPPLRPGGELNYDRLPTCLAPSPDGAPLEMPILELDDVVLFPGCTVPLRLRTPEWVEYLGTRIDEARLGRGGFGARVEVRVGILMGLSEARRRVRSERRVGTTDAQEREESSPANQQTARQSRRRLSSPASPSPTREDPLVGRIGTVATITNTHENTNEDRQGGSIDNDGDEDPSAPYRSRVWLRHSGQLVLTALGTSRFRIVSGVDNITEGSRHRHMLNHQIGDMADIKIYRVERLEDANLPLPPVSVRRGVRFSIPKDSSTIENAGKTKGAHHNSGQLLHSGMIRHLSYTTPIPALAYNFVWPWRLVHDICAELINIPAWEGLRNSLPASSGWVTSSDSSTAAGQPFSHLSNASDPMAFSFWMASNLPLSDFERLDLLELQCTSKRLLRILKKVTHQREVEMPIQCSQCGEKLSTVDEMFTVLGAEGTTGAYVNEHGVVHQTITVRTVEIQAIVCVNRPESRDSWFPGYAWTIIHCAQCFQHLGWMFDLEKKYRRDRSDMHDKDLPIRFFGLSGGKTTTEERPRQENHHTPLREAVLDIVRDRYPD